MSALIVICKECFAEYEPDRETIMQGYTVWSLCQGCRPGALALSEPQKQNDDYDANPEGRNE
jgi:hypothetical protein